MSSEPNLYGALVTFRRAHVLPQTLAGVLGQTQRLARLIVIDNDPTDAVQRLVAAAAAAHPRTPVHYVAAPENLGPAGGWALGMDLILNEASPDDWIVTFDDNNPPVRETELEEVLQFASTQRHAQPRLGGVGIIGARFNWRTGLIERVPDQELTGPVSVDYFGGGFLPLYSVSAVRAVGALAPKLFFGYVELEFGLRLRRAGYTLLADGDLWLQRRIMWGRCHVTVRPSRVCKIHWQKYYRIRNYIATMLEFGRPDLAVRWAVIQCVAKPLYSFLRSPRTGYQGFRQALSAARDGFRGQLGRTVEPPPGPPSRD